MTTTPKTKNQKRKTSPRISAETYYPDIYPDKLDPHPANPTSRTETDQVDELMQSIEQFGQRERVRVRTSPDAVGRFQILSGHRRAKACFRLDRQVRCEVVDIDDDEALREVMLGNAERKDLDAIQRAELLQVMIDSGIDKAEAGRLFGLNSASGVKNTLRILKLPQSIHELIKAKKIPSRAVRYLVPYAEAHVLLNALAKSLDDDEWALADFVSSGGEWTPENTEYRPMDGETKYSPGWQYETAVRQFDPSTLTPEQITALAIVEIPVNGKSIEVAQNVELFDQLNSTYVVKTSPYGNQPKQKPLKPEPGKKLTPAQIKAEEKRKAKEADDRLNKRIPLWIRRFKRCCLATQTPPKHYAIVGTLPYWLGHCNVFDNDAYIIQAAETLGVKPSGKRTSRIECESLNNAIATMTDGTADAFIDRLWRILVWPQIIAWRLGPKSDASLEDHAVITAANELPQKLIAGGEFIDIDQPLDEIIRLADVSLSGGWIDAASDGNPERLLLRELLEMHTQTQLVAFAFQMKVSIFDTDKKSHIVDSIMNAHTFAKPLPCPAFLSGKALAAGPNKRKQK